MYTDIATTETMQALRNEAAMARDTQTVETINLAMAGDEDALWEVADALHEYRNAYPETE